MGSVEDILMNLVMKADASDVSKKSKKAKKDLDKINSGKTSKKNVDNAQTEATEINKVNQQKTQLARSLAIEEMNQQIAVAKKKGTVLKNVDVSARAKAIQNTKAFTQASNAEAVKQLAMDKKYALQKKALVIKNTQEAKKSVFSFQRAMGALSFLFIGQQIAAVMQRIASTTISTFMEITKGQTEASKGITLLTAHFTALKFTIGNALATALLPLLPTIISIVERVKEFANAHPKILAFGIAFVFAASMAALMGAQLILLAAGLQNLLYGAKGAGGLVKMQTMMNEKGFFTTFSTGLKTLGSKLWTFMISPVGIAIIVLALMAALINRMPTVKAEVTESFTAVGDALSNLLETIISIFGPTIDLKDGLDFLSIGAGLLANALAGALLGAIIFIGVAITGILAVLRSGYAVIELFFMALGYGFLWIVLKAQEAWNKLNDLWGGTDIDTSGTEESMNSISDSMGGVVDDVVKSWKNVGDAFQVDAAVTITENFVDIWDAMQEQEDKSDALAETEIKNTQDKSDAINNYLVPALDDQESSFLNIIDAVDINAESTKLLTEVQESNITTTNNAVEANDAETESIKRKTQAQLDWLDAQSKAAKKRADDSISEYLGRDGYPT